MEIQQLLLLKESEDHVEFKAATKNFKYAGGDNKEPKDRRHCVLGYITAFCNDGGGMLVLGISDEYPHKVVGTTFAEGKEGELTDKIYADIGIRIETSVLSEAGKRVLVISIPSRPIGRLMKFEGVPLMRTGESLREMSDQEMLRILNEQEPDFSATICEGLTVNDLDHNAIRLMKEKYARKQQNVNFLTQSIEQVLSDLDLSRNGKLTYAALILVGKREAIKLFLPQSKIHLEYRSDPNSIHFDSRIIHDGSFFLNIDVIWDNINLRNGKSPIQQGAFIYDISFLNEEVVRESINNSIAHRDYKLQSEVVVKQSNVSLEVISPGGFPLGVSIDNILTVNSTPRNRLLADVLLKTGVVERSGQGVDKLFINNILESKGLPDYAKSDNYQVDLFIPTIVQDAAFFLFIEYIQNELNITLSLVEVLTLEKIRVKEAKSALNKSAIKSLLDKNLIEPIGKTNPKGYILSKEYYSFTNQPATYTKVKGPELSNIWLQVYHHLSEFPKAKISVFESLFNGMLTREQVKYYIYLFLNLEILDKEGAGKGTFYKLNKSILQSENPMQAGLNKLKNA